MSDNINTTKAKQEILVRLKEDVNNLPEDDDWPADWECVYEMAKMDFKNLIDGYAED